MQSAITIRRKITGKFIPSTNWPMSAKGKPAAPGPCMRLDMRLEQTDVAGCDSYQETMFETDGTARASFQETIVETLGERLGRVRAANAGTAESASSSAESDEETTPVTTSAKKGSDLLEPAESDEETTPLFTPGKKASELPESTLGDLLDELERCFFGEEQCGAIVSRFQALERPLMLSTPRPSSVDQRVREISQRMKEKFPSMAASSASSSCGAGSSGDRAAHAQHGPQHVLADQLEWDEGGGQNADYNGNGGGSNEDYSDLLGSLSHHEPQHAFTDDLAGKVLDEGADYESCLRRDHARNQDNHHCDNDYSDMLYTE